MGRKPRPSDKPAQGQRVGYARVSTASQNIDSQLDMLGRAGCSKTFADTITGTARARPGWDALMEYVRPGDTLVVTELSRMSRSLSHLLQVVDQLAERQVGIMSLRESIDTSTATGRLFLSIMGAVAQMERELRAERAAAGRAAARARGRSGGRPRTAPEKLERARILYESGSYTAAQAAQAAGIGRRTLFEYLASRNSPGGEAMLRDHAPR
jgi:DNA invertase Pin-like site-specific DNA recombinase